MPLIKSISGIRGTIGGQTGETLSPVDVVKFTAAYGAILKKMLRKTNLSKWLLAATGALAGAW
ncbi:hypothetical protein [Niabella ginsengisoli]|uniref:Uncharacterized protein n=1 Tax=Niabella ginsengisoli TaxID=522298 RepID=A0ABS9SDZ6_9BACT|nr:hypothetical protein [Niabella ginsengisoli]MCH5596579.1 hypothetical protein [Niabella ginsengisoli]